MNKKHLHPSIEQKLLREEQFDKSWQNLSDQAVNSLDSIAYGITNSFLSTQAINSCCSFLSFIKNTFVPPSPCASAA